MTAMAEDDMSEVDTLTNDPEFMRGQIETLSRKAAERIVLAAQNVHLRSLVRRFANSWAVVIDHEGYWWWKPDPHVDGMRRERFTTDETTAYLAVCNEQGVTWPI